MLNKKITFKICILILVISKNIISSYSSPYLPINIGQTFLVSSPEKISSFNSRNIKQMEQAGSSSLNHPIEIPINLYLPRTCQELVESELEAQKLWISLIYNPDQSYERYKLSNLLKQYISSISNPETNSEDRAKILKIYQSLIFLAKKYKSSDLLYKLSTTRQEIYSRVISPPTPFLFPYPN